jgi:purine-nucleoside phosphorylase
MTNTSFFDGSSPILTPEQYLGTDRPKLPETFFLFFYDSPRMKALLKTNKPDKVRNIPGSHIVAEGIGYKKMMMGCDMSVFMLELLMACGVKRFVVFGTACSITEKIGFKDICVVEKAVCEEAVSMHYGPYIREVAATSRINGTLCQCAEEISLPAPLVKTCTIPALFRETEGKIGKLRSEEVSVLDMESSALITAANSKRAEISFLFFISDRIIDKKWEKEERMDFAAEGRLIDGLLSSGSFTP